MGRAFVRQWLALPNDISIGYFHAPVSEGFPPYGGLPRSTARTAFLD